MRPAGHHPNGEAGFAMVAAVVAMGLFAVLALVMLDGSRGTAAGARASIVHAQLAAGADAGLAIAAANLVTPDRARRWSIDGRRRYARFDGTDLTIAVEDEAGARFWLFRRGDGVDDATGDLSWYMHGLFG